MARIDIIIPAMGEGVTEATITRWMVKEGDFIDEDTPVVEIATDKVDSEITAPAAGYLKKIVRNEGEIPKIGDTIGIMVSEKNESTSDEKLIVKTETDANILRPEKEEQKETQKTQHASISYQADDSIESKKTGFISPLVKKMATEMNISPNELSSIKGTSSSGRITRDDFYNYLKNKKSGVRQEISQKEEEPAFLSRNQIYGSDDNRVEKMSRTRQLIAKHMNYSVKTSAHVTSFHEADVTNLVKWREKNKNDFLRKHGQKLTFTPLFLEAIIHALKKYPNLNISVDNNNIIYKQKLNIGMATALPNGNLIVPVIKNAGSKNLKGLATEVNDLAQRARENKLNPEEIQGGTFTFTNLGAFGTLTGTPVINQPQVAILAAGAILKKPAAIKTRNTWSIGIRDICMLSMSYDHRVIDGALGGMFLQQVALYLEDFNPERII